MNQKLGSTAKDEIRRCLAGLAGSALKAEAERLADIHNVSVSCIYSATKDMRTGTRKKRSDAGKRKFTLEEGTDTFEAAALVIGAKLDPDQALLTCKANGHTDVPTLGTFQKLLRDHDLGRKARRDGRRNHRRFEAAAPLDIVQIDSSALKVRWLDHKTRRIIRLEGIDKNHPQTDPTMLRVWQIVAVDDHSRRRKTKYIATHHITSSDMVRFCCELFCEWGLPKMLYTDNGPEFKAFFAQAVKIIESLPAIKDNGGFEHRTHAPGNAQASGKVEISHQRVEKMNRYIGLADQRGLTVTIEDLEGFSQSIDKYDNEVKVHRTTGETPLARWSGQRVVTRMLPAEYIRAALLFREAECRISDGMTVRVDKVDYRIPTHGADGKASPFKQGMKLNVVVPSEHTEIFLTLANGEGYAVPKILATADVAGDYKKAAETQGEKLTKQLKAHHATKNREAKELRKQTGEVFQVPFYNHEVQAPETNVVRGAFPNPEILVAASELQQATPVPMDEITQPDRGRTVRSEKAADLAYTGQKLSYWDAVDQFKSRFETIADAKAFLLELFPNKQGSLASTEIETAVYTHFNPERQEVPGIRLAG